MSRTGTRNGRGGRFWLVMLAFALAAGWQPASLRGQATAVVPVQVERVAVAESSSQKRFLGTVMPRRRSLVGSAVDGRVEKVLVDEGDPVRAGDDIVQLLLKTINILVAAAEAEQELRQQEYNEMLAGSRSEEIDRARAQLASAEAVREYRNAAFERTRELFNSSRTASREEYEEALQAKVAADQDVEERKANLALVLAGPRQEQVAQAKARLAMATEEVNRLEDRREKYTIRAPFDGYLVTKRAEVGQWLKEGDLVAEIIQLDPVEIQVAVPESYISQLRVGLPAGVSVAAHEGRTYPGQITRIVPQADLQSRAFPVVIEMPNPREGDGHALKAGMLTHVHFAVGGAPGEGLMVPKDALVLGGPAPLVYVVRSGMTDQPPTAQPVAVELGPANGNWIQVKGELAAGEQVVTRGNERLRPGQPVNILPPAGSAPAK